MYQGKKPSIYNFAWLVIKIQEDNNDVMAMLSGYAMESLSA